MYGTVAHMQLKPGAEAEMQQQMKQYEALNVPGFVRSTIYRMDSNPNELYLAVVFENKEAYHANANNPERNALYEKMRSLLTRDPEWHDGEIIYYR